MSVSVSFLQKHAPRIATTFALLGVVVAVQPVLADSAGMARCQELYGVWQRYKAVSTNSSGRDVQSQAALQECRSGHLEAGIAQLEQLLKDDRIPVPQVSSAAR